MLTSFQSPIHAVVVGASGGIGAALVEQLLADQAVATVTACARTAQTTHHHKLQSVFLDVTDEQSITEAAAYVDQAALIIVATGILHGPDGLAPEKNWRALDAAKLAKLFAINTIGPALVAKHFLPRLPKHGKSVFAALSARVASISDNHLGGWYGYRSSKAALNMMIRNLSIELAPRWRDAVCVGLHPGTVATPLSAPFQANIATQKLFSPQQSASALLSVIDTLTPADSGYILAWDGQRIEF